MYGIQEKSKPAPARRAADLLPQKSSEKKQLKEDRLAKKTAKK